MVLRLILTGIVTAMGLSLPTRGDVAAWGRSTRGWIEAHVSECARNPAAPDAGLPDDDAIAGDTWYGDLTSSRLDGMWVSAGVVEAQSPDAPFAAIVDEMADAFTADLAMLERDQPKAKTHEFEPIEVAADLYPGEAYALNRASDGLAATTDEAPETGSRFANAVRLTRDAVFAWTKVLHGSAVMTISR